MQSSTYVIIQDLMQSNTCAIIQDRTRSPLTWPKPLFHPNIILVNKFVYMQDIPSTKMVPVDWSTRWFMVDSKCLQSMNQNVKKTGERG